MTEKARLPDFEQVAQALADAGSLSGPSEVHGMLCGMLCADAATGSDAWLRQIMSDTSPDQVPADEERDILRQLFAATVYQLEEPELNFTLLLPPDEETLDERVEFLGYWCEGFLFGLGVGGIEQSGTMPEDVQEFLDDLTAISRVGLDADHGSDKDEDEGELAYAEVAEYVRLGVLLVNELLQPRPASNPPPQLH